MTDARNTKPQRDKSYKKPALKKFGKIQGLTTGGSSGGPEMNANQTNKKP